MVKRTITSIIGLPILIFLVLSGGIWMQVALGLVATIALYEFYNAFGRLNILGMAGVLYAIIFIIFLGQTFAEPYLLLILFPLITMCVMIVKHKTIGFNEAAIAIVGFFFIVLDF